MKNNSVAEMSNIASKGNESERLNDPKVLAQVLFLTSLLFLLVALILTYSGTKCPFIASLLGNIFTSLFILAFAISFIDPITRQIVEIAERRRWDRFKNATDKYVNQALQNLITSILIPLYNYLYVNGKLPTGAQPLGALTYITVREDAKQFLQVASEMYGAVDNFLNTDNENNSIAIGSFLITYGDKMSTLRQSIKSFERVWMLYNSSPVPDPETILAINECYFTAANLADVLKLEVNSKNEPKVEMAKLGLDTATILFIAKKAIEAYSRIFVPNK